MSHVSPANFQALDQRVSRRFLIGKMPVVVRQRHMAKRKWRLHVSENFLTPASRKFILEFPLSVLGTVDVLSVIYVLFFVVVRWSGLEFGRR